MTSETASAPPPAAKPAAAARARLDERTWGNLIKRIKEERCTPVIGSGACTAAPIGCDPEEWAALRYPSREQISLAFAREYEYPLEDQKQLERVARYVAATNDVLAPKEAYAKFFEDLPTPNFAGCASEPHRVLAELPFPVYLTSNFDDWMSRALKQHAKRDAQVALCRWNRHIPDDAPSFDPEFEYTVANPLVYHFHGCTPWPESAVVSEDDYFEFLINISRDTKSLAHRVDRAMGGALLFLGYTLADWDFLVLFRLFANKLRDSGTTHVAVQLEPGEGPGTQSQTAQKAMAYLNSYFGNAKIKIYWGSCQQFCHDLRLHWEAAEKKA